MTARSVSPGGALLRASRMFSLPAPIPPPPGDMTASNYYSSDTATLAFPTHQVISTLSSARKVGDWGLKRPLPLKSTTSSTHPMLRVKAIDTVEQITDFTSGSDHGMTLRKFQELGLPITLRMQTDGVPVLKPMPGKPVLLPQKSVFDEDIDFTAIDPKNRAAAIDQRWKFSGPWLAGLTPGEFNKWLAKEVRPKRSAFRQFLKQKFAEHMNEAATKVAQDKGGSAPAPIGADSVTEDQLANYLRKLRHHNQELYDLVGQFLDLAPLTPPSGIGEWKKSNTTVVFREVKNPYATLGPPVTHPSAGISYLRTSMYLTNHPIYGPQKTHPPVVARIVRPRRMGQGLRAKLGVAGFIVDTYLGSTASSKDDSKSLLYDQLDPTLEGGAKVWVHPQRAWVDSNGRVVLFVSDYLPEALLVAQELLGRASCLGPRQNAAQAQVQAQNQRAPTSDDIRRRYRNGTAGTRAMSSAQDYGLRQ